MSTDSPLSAFLNPEYQFMHYESGPDEPLLRQLFFAYISGTADCTELDLAFKRSRLAHSCDRLACVAYTPGKKRIVITREQASGKWPLSAVIDRIIQHPRSHELSEATRFQLDFIRKEATPINLYRVGMRQSGSRHFEIGVDGLEITGADGKQHYFLPGDAYIFSIMGMKQLRELLVKRYTEAYLVSAQIYRLQSESYLISPDGITPLYRGLPRVGAVTKQKLEQCIQASIQHIKQNQYPDGRFLYYYDAAKDSLKDFEHPKRDPVKNPYYNILRHSGGGMTCVYYEKYFARLDSLAAIRKAIDYLKSCAVFSTAEGVERAYILSERKSKLGGAGLALYLIAEYQLLTKDETYQRFASALAEHLLSQITASGEFMYYNIYLNRELGPEDNQEYFSFYYPGEALCGLAQFIKTQPDSERGRYFPRLHKALHFLLVERPKVRADHYSNLPSDSWLMLAIAELWDFPEMQRESYKDFVFSDARKMIQQMYNVADAPYPDYAGAFYYTFGDYPYSDGARMEGVVAAYDLAVKAGAREEQVFLWQAMKLGAWSLLHLVNTPEALYAAKNPARALGGIRFKYTRQWFRIDTIQHVAGFFAKMLPFWDQAEQSANPGAVSEEANG